MTSYLYRIERMRVPQVTYIAGEETRALAVPRKIIHVFSAEQDGANEQVLTVLTMDEIEQEPEADLGDLDLRPVPDLGNWQGVGRNGEGTVSVPMARQHMTTDEALVHAAWLVSVADPILARFPQILRAVQRAG